MSRPLHCRRTHVEPPGSAYANAFVLYNVEPARTRVAKILHQPGCIGEFRDHAEYCPRQRVPDTAAGTIKPQHYAQREERIAQQKCQREPACRPCEKQGNKRQPYAPRQRAEIFTSAILNCRFAVESVALRQACPARTDRRHQARKVVMPLSCVAISASSLISRWPASARRTPSSESSPAIMPALKPSTAFNAETRAHMICRDCRNCGSPPSRRTIRARSALNICCWKMSVREGGLQRQQRLHRRPSLPLRGAQNPDEEYSRRQETRHTGSRENSLEAMPARRCGRGPQTTSEVSAGRSRKRQDGRRLPGYHPSRHCRHTQSARRRITRS